MPKAAIPRVKNVFIRLYNTPLSLDKREALIFLSTIAKQLGYTVLAKKAHAFHPTGITALLLLSESHLSFHTWPESSFAVLEMVTCKSFHKKELAQVVQLVKNALRPRKIRVTLTV